MHVTELDEYAPFDLLGGALHIQISDHLLLELQLLDLLLALPLGLTVMSLSLQRLNSALPPQLISRTNYARKSAEHTCVV